MWGAGGPSLAGAEQLQRFVDWTAPRQGRGNSQPLPSKPHVPEKIPTGPGGQEAAPLPPSSCSPVEELPMTTVSTLTSVTASSSELFPRRVMAATMAWAALWIRLLSGRSRAGLKD